MTTVDSSNVVAVVQGLVDLVLVPNQTQQMEANGELTYNQMRERLKTIAETVEPLKSNTEAQIKLVMDRVTNVELRLHHCLTKRTKSLRGWRNSGRRLMVR